MLSKKVTIVNPSGLHLRPAGVLAQTSMKFACDIKLYFADKTIVAKSVLNIMAAAVKSGSTLELVCDGDDEAEALEAVSHAIENGLGEL